MRIDAHHHLWRYSPAEYEWIDDRMHVLQKDFLPAHLRDAMNTANVHATIAVQARQTLEETNWLLRLAAESDLIAGVVGWAPIAAPDFAAILDGLRQHPRLKGLRHVVQAEQAGFLDTPAFNSGIALLRDSGLVYDLLIQWPQLQEATRFVRRHPGQVFVVDHLAKPAIANGGLEQWSAGLRELSRCENVVCKISGMVTEADWNSWTPGDLKAYFDVALDCFGPSRLMAGSDWPVLLLACGYAEWWQLIASWLQSLTAPERREIEGDVAARVYRLHDLPSPASTETTAGEPSAK